MTGTIRPALLWPLSVLVGAAVFFATCLVEPPARHTLNFGNEFAAMAQDPFGLIGPFPQRLLGPLVAHCLGLAGERYWLFAHGCSVVFIALLFAAAVTFGARWWQALLLTCVIAFTGAVQIYKGHLGYPEPITFLLLLATMLAARRPVLFWTLQVLNVFNHEQILLFWPWLMWWRRQHPGARWRDDLIGAAVVIALYAPFRMWVGATATEQQATLGLYLSFGYFPIGTAGLAILNVVSTFLWFGLLPVLVCWHAFVDGWRRAGAQIVLFLATIFAIFALAHDVYRFTCFLFVPVLFAGLRLLQERGGAPVLAAFGVASTVAIWLQRDVFVALSYEVLTEKDAAGNLHVRSDIVADIVPKVIPAMPWTFVAYGLALVATVVAGWAWARRSRAASPA